MRKLVFQLSVELYYVRAKEELTSDNILMIVSYLQERILDESGLVKNIITKHSSSEEYPLDNIPNEINVVNSMNMKITRQEFAHILNLYKNNIIDFIYYTPCGEDYIN